MPRLRNMEGKGGFGGDREDRKDSPTPIPRNTPLIYISECGESASAPLNGASPSSFSNRTSDFSFVHACSGYISQG